MVPHDEARNVAPPAGAHAFWAYVGAVTIAGFALLAWQLSLIHASDLQSMGARFRRSSRSWSSSARSGRW